MNNLQLTTPNERTLLRGSYKFSRFSKMSAKAFRVFCYISSHKICFVSLDRMSKSCCLSKNTVKKGVKELLSLNVIRAKERSGRTNLYIVNPEKDWSEDAWWREEDFHQEEGDDWSDLPHSDVMSSGHSEAEVEKNGEGAVSTCEGGSQNMTPKVLNISVKNKSDKDIYSFSSTSVLKEEDLHIPSTHEDIVSSLRSITRKYSTDQFKKIKYIAFVAGFSYSYSEEFLEILEFEVRKKFKNTQNETVTSRFIDELLSIYLEGFHAQGNLELIDAYEVIPQFIHDLIDILMYREGHPKIDELKHCFECVYKGRKSRPEQNKAVFCILRAFLAYGSESQLTIYKILEREINSYLMSDEYRTHCQRPLPEYHEEISQFEKSFDDVRVN